MSGVEVPLENVIGDVGGGWDVAMTTLLHERGTLGFALVARLEVQVKKLVALAADRGATPTQREAIAREWIHLQALRVTAYRSLSALERTGVPGPGGLDPQAAVVGGEPARDEARARAARPGRVSSWRRTRRTAATGRPSSCGAAATRSRPARRRSSATSSPSGCSGCRGRGSSDADGPLVHPAPGGAARTGADVPRGDPRADLGAARGARLDGRDGGRGARRRRAHVPRGGRAPRGGGARAAPRAALVDVVPAPRSCPADDQAAVAAGEASWTLALGPLVPDLDTATRVAVVGGDTIWELEGFEREVLATSDETRPLGVVSGGEAGRALCIVRGAARRSGRAR